MMKNSGLDRRKKALEEAFFKDLDGELLKKLQEKKIIEARKETLSNVTGIKDMQVLDKLLKLKLCGDTVIALYLVPLVEVAWADAKIQDDERAAILKAAQAKGISKDSPGYSLLEKWLSQPLDDELLNTWKSCIAALGAELDADAFAAMKEEVIGKAREVASAAGGFLGLTNKVSSQEEDMLTELESAFA